VIFQISIEKHSTITTKKTNRVASQSKIVRIFFFYFFFLFWVFFGFFSGVHEDFIESPPQSSEFNIATSLQDDLAVSSGQPSGGQRHQSSCSFKEAVESCECSQLEVNWFDKSRPMTRVGTAGDATLGH
jgi:hypothetical protein